MQGKNLLRRGLIGVEIEIIGSKNKANVGVKGRIIDETKNSLIILTKNQRKRVMKQNITAILDFKDVKAKIKGALLLGRADERIKRLPQEVR